MTARNLSDIGSRIDRLFEAETRADTAESRLVEVEAQRDRLRDMTQRLADLLERITAVTSRNCGWLPHEDQQTLREARAAVEESR